MSMTEIFTKGGECLENGTCIDSIAHSAEGQVRWVASARVHRQRIYPGDVGAGVERTSEEERSVRNGTQRQTRPRTPATKGCPRQIVLACTIVS